MVSTVLEHVMKKEEEPDEERMRDIEDSISVKDDERELWRFNILSRVTAFATSKSTEILDFRVLYKDLYDAVHSKLYETKKRNIK